MVKLLSDQSTVAKGSHWQVRKGQGWGRGGRTETVARGLHWQMRRGWPGGGRGGRGLKAHWRMSRSEGVISRWPIIGWHLDRYAVKDLTPRLLLHGVVYI